MRKALVFVLLVCAAAFAAGCSQGTGYTTANLREAGVRTVAIAPVEGAADINASQQIAAIFGDQLRSKGYIVTQVGTAGAAVAGPPATTAAPGAAPVQPAAAPADATLYISVPQFGQEIAMNARLVSNITGETLWQGSGEGDTHKTLATVGGAVGGAVAGAAVGGEEHRVAGAVIGGAAGGAGGYFLTPDQEKVSRQIINKMMGTFPAA